MISKLFKVVSFPFFRPWAFFSHIWCTRQWWSWMLFFSIKIFSLLSRFTLFHQQLFNPLVSNLLGNLNDSPPVAVLGVEVDPGHLQHRTHRTLVPWKKISDSWNFPKQTKYCPDRYICSPFATAAIRGVHPSLVLELRLEIEKITKLQFVDFSRDFVQSYMFICAVGAICFSLPGETIHCC